MKFFVVTLLVFLLTPANVLAMAGPIENMSFIVIPDGSFEMGSPTNEIGRIANEGPQHTVFIDSFEMMTTEVTQGMWQSVMGTTIVDIHALSDRSSAHMPSRSNLPMAGLNYYDCLEFIDELNLLDTLYVYRLPSESEWEYSCRAGTVTAFYWGNDTNASVMNLYCWSASHPRNIVPVGQLLPNSWGLYDMSGSVWEWTADWWNDSYANWTGAPMNGSAWTEGNFGDTHVLRGGTNSSPPAHCRSSVRNAIATNLRYPSSGFRLVRESVASINSALLIQEGDIHQYNMEFDNAIQSYNQALAIDPSNPNVFISRGYLYARTGSFDLAILDFETSMSLDVNQRSNGLYNIACVYGLSNNPEKAIEFLESAVAEGFTYLDGIEYDPDFDLVREQEIFKAGVLSLEESLVSHKK